MRKVILQIALGASLLIPLAVPMSAAAQSLPTPADFVRFLDLRCYRTPDQLPLNVPLRLDHLNRVLLNYGVPPEDVLVQEAQELCVPVRKENQVIPSTSLPFLRYADLECYGIRGKSLDLPLRIDQLNPIIAAKLGPQTQVIVREPNQLCVPVAKNNAVIPPAVLRLIQHLDVKCYRVEAPAIPDTPIRLTHLNPLFSTLPTELAEIKGPAPIQLCVPVTKNQVYPPTDVAAIIRYSDVLCYNLKGADLGRDLRLTHLNPVLKAMGLPDESVVAKESTKLCVPVAKDGDFPPTIGPAGLQP